MGDLIMSGPAIRALKETFGARITVLTSSMANGITPMIPEIDEVMIYDMPWVKTAKTPDSDTFSEMLGELRSRNFDAAVIFTVYSQNPQPTAMLAYFAGIPKVLAYCRENPYHLINNWVPDKEPYDLIKHQVQRDIDLVAAVGASASSTNLHLKVNNTLWAQIGSKLQSIGVDVNRPWLLFHPGVSEKKREYPLKHWINAAQMLRAEGYQLIVTGSGSEKILTDELAAQAGDGCFSAGGLFPLDEFVCLIKHAPLLVSVNTGTIHIAAAVKTPVVVLYAQTNPQHTPWKVPCEVLPFAVPAHARSRNEVIKYVNRTLYSEPVAMPTARDVVNAVDRLLSSPNSPILPSREIQDENQAIAAS